MLLIVIIVIFSIIAIISRKPNYSINDPLKNYNLQNTNNKNEYLDFLKESEDCEVNCSLDMQNKTISVEVYGDFNPEDTEPTYYHTHHFHYTLDNEGNVNDVLFDYTE